MGRTPSCHWYKSKEMRRAKSASAGDSPTNRSAKRSKLSKNPYARRLYTSARTHSLRGSDAALYSKLCQKAGLTGVK